MVTRRSLLVGSAAVLGSLGTLAARGTRAAAAMELTVPPGAAAGFDLPGGLFCPVPYMNRAAWGADESLRYTNNGGYWTEDYFPVRTITVHHTGFVVDPDAAKAVRDIYTKQTLQGDGTTGGGVGWGDIGYNLLIDDQGVVYEGRYSGTDGFPVFNPDGNMVTGAHVLHYNTGNIGVCLLGYLDDGPATPAAQDSLTTVLAYLAVAGHVNPTGMVNYVNAAPGYTQYAKTVHAISGHRDWAATDCPGSAEYPLLPGIRTGAAAALPEPVTSPSPSASASPTATATASPSASASGTPSATPTPSKTPTPTPSKTKAVSRDRGGDEYVAVARKTSPSQYPTKRPKPTPTPTATPSRSPSASPSVTAGTPSPSGTSSSAPAVAAREVGGTGWGFGATVAGVAAVGAISSVVAWRSRQRRPLGVAEVTELSTVDEMSTVEEDVSPAEVTPPRPPAPDPSEETG
jgi:hypothetical protein